MKSIQFRIFFFFTLLPIISTEKRIVCYYTNWSVYRYTTVPVLYPDSIDPSLCTHIHVAFALINPITLKIEPSENHDIHYTNIFSTPLYSRLYSLKEFQPSIKLLISVGGWTAGSKAFNNILTNSITRSMFIQQAKEFLLQWNFDGIDLDWEFPGDFERDASSNSRERFNILIQEMYESFQNDSNQFLLTAAVSANPIKIDLGYIVPDFCHYLDYVSLMTYDYHGAWDNVTGMNAPLYGRSYRDGDVNNNEWNVNGSVHYWLAKGCPAEKINLGLAMYGRSFTLMNNSNSIDVGAETMGGGLAGPYTKNNGTLAYFEICQKLRVFNWINEFDMDAQVPYAYSLSVNSSNKQWVSYDDLESVTAKVLYAKSLDLGGVMIWSLDQDDYTGLFCNQGEFPLTRRVYHILRSSNNSPEQELFNSTVENEQQTSFVSIELYTTQWQILTSTQSSSDSRILLNGNETTIGNVHRLQLCTTNVLQRPGFIVSNIFHKFHSLNGRNSDEGGGSTETKS